MDRVMKLRTPFWMPLVLTSALVLALVTTVSCGGDEETGGGATATVGATEEASATPEGEGASAAIATVGDLEIVEAYARSVELGGAAYFTIENTGDTDDALVGAASDVARRVELHETVTEEGMHKMLPVDEIAVPAGGEAVLEPGGYHVMLLDLKEELAVGDTFHITLTFEKAGSVDLEIEVRPFVPIATVGDLDIVKAYARVVELGGAAYFTIKNTGDTDDALVGAASDAARRVELHETVTEGTTDKMLPVEQIAIPAGREAVLQPGGYHVMLMDLNEELAVGDTVPITLTFEKAGSVDLEVEVKPFTE
jgi:copper(I)-binding protein